MCVFSDVYMNFCSCDLDLDLMTFVHELDAHILNIYSYTIGQGFQLLEHKHKIETCTGSGETGTPRGPRGPRGVGYESSGETRGAGATVTGRPAGPGASDEHVVLPVASFKLNLPALTCSAGLHFTLPQSAAHRFLLFQSTAITRSRCRLSVLVLQPDNWAKLQFVAGTGIGTHPRHAEYICIIVISAFQWMHRVGLTLYCWICCTITLKFTV